MKLVLMIVKSGISEKSILCVMAVSFVMNYMPERYAYYIDS